MGDYNSEVGETDMSVFYDTYNLQNVINAHTCFKSANNPTSIDLLLTNKSECFQNSVAIETGLSDHRKLIATVLKTHLNKLKPNIIKYRKFNTMDEFNLKSELLHTLKASVRDNMNHDEFKKHFLNVLNKHAPLKQKVIRGNNAPFYEQNLIKSFHGKKINTTEIPQRLTKHCIINKETIV